MMPVCYHCGASGCLLISPNGSLDRLICLPCLKVNNSDLYRKLYIWCISHPAPKPKEVPK